MKFDHVAQQVSDIAEAVQWTLQTIPGSRVMYQDATWAFVDVVGTKLAFVKHEQHPGHIAWQVEEAELERLAKVFAKKVVTHRDNTRGFYVQTPWKGWIEYICYPKEAATSY